MSRPLTIISRLGAASLLVMVLVLPRSVHAQGVAIGGVGPVNRAMAGAATAAPIDAAGAIMWNPATMSGLEHSEFEIGLEVLLPTEKLSSSIEAGALGGGFPPVRLAGSNTGEPGVSALPTLAFAQKIDGSSWTYGLGMFAIAGFHVNYPSSTTNPILMPQNNTPGGFGGLGRINAQAEFFQILPMLSYAVTDKLSVGFGPTITLANFSANPLFLVAPDDADGSGVARYPQGNGTRYNWGGGFQAGVYYITDTAWHFGFSIKSPQWFEPIRVNTADELGFPRTETIHFDYPLILSLGTAYSGIENWLFACDVRYFDYANASGFGDPAGFAADGSVTGLGWKSLVSVHTGVQYRVTQRLYLRMGYQYNDNPIDSSDSFFNVASPLVIQHVVSTGFSYYLTEQMSVSLAYVHGFENSTSGPIQVPGVGALAGTSVTSAVSADSLGAAFSVQY